MNTKTPLALATAALLALGLTACNRNDDANGGTNNTPTPTGDASTDPMAPTGPQVVPGTDTGADAAAPTQAEALALINVVNDHEIKAAEMAKQKNVTGPALEYANMMQAEHSQNMTQTTALLGQHGSGATDTARITDQRAKGEAKRNQLAALNGDAFARAYLDQMVMDHQETLTLLDAMMPAATDEAVRSHMTMTREAVQKHLDQARQLQGQMGGATGAAAGGTGQG